MPGLEGFEALARSYGFSVALLLAGGSGLMLAIVTLYRETRRLRDKLEEVLEERVKTLETLLSSRLGPPDR